MSQFVEVPPNRLEPEVLDALLQEYASRDGTDYGEREISLEQKVQQLHGQLQERSLALLFDADAEVWDLVQREQADQLLQD